MSKPGDEPLRPIHVPPTRPPCDREQQRRSHRADPPRAVAAEQEEREAAHEQAEGKDALPRLEGRLAAHVGGCHQAPLRRVGVHEAGSVADRRQGSVGSYAARRPTAPSRTSRLARSALVGRHRKRASAPVAWPPSRLDIDGSGAFGPPLPPRLVEAPAKSRSCEISVRSRRRGAGGLTPLPGGVSGHGPAAGSRSRRGSQGRPASSKAVAAAWRGEPSPPGRRRPSGSALPGKRDALSGGTPDADRAEA